MSLAAVLIGLLPLARSAVAASVTLPAVADTTALEGSSVGRGSATTLQADGSPRAEIFVRFDLAGTAKPVTRARLRLWVTNGSSDGPTLYPVTSPWSEATLKWQNRPTHGAAAGDAARTTVGTWQEYDVTALVQAGIANFTLIAAASDGTDFASREASRNRPHIVLQTGTTSTSATTTSTTVPPDPANHPNVMVILTDDQRADQTLDVMPKTRQWLQTQGTKFPQGYVTTPLCCPERSTLMSGRYMHNHTVYDNGQDEKLDKNWTLQRYLKDDAYQTAMAGKYLVGWPNTDAPPHFDHYALTSGGYKDTAFNVDGHTRRVAYSTDFIGEFAGQFLDGFEANDSQPWYFYVTPQAPHSDFVPSDKYASAPVPAFQPGPSFNDDNADKAPFLRGRQRTLSQTVAEHDGQLRTLLSVDDMVDSIMRKLQANGELDNTLVIFTSDNGYHWGEFGVQGKGLPYTESVKVPFLVRWPGHVAAGATDNRLVAGVDILPTVLDATGYQPPELGYPLDGHSLLGSFARTESLTEFHHGYKNWIPSWGSIRTPGWFYVEYYASDDTTISYREYYNLTADPDQLHNVLADSSTANDPDVAVLSGRVAKYRRCAGTTGTTACP
jgi:arylsulfatase A-like enzyme